MQEYRKGCICLDIDGTITADPYAVPDVVVDYFRSLYKQGWSFLFITGRLYSFAVKTLGKIDFPYFLALQNGADLLWMPEKTLLAREYLSSTVIPILEEMCQDRTEDFLLYAGLDRGDFCYYRPERFSPKMQEHLRIVQTLSHKSWQTRKDFFFEPEEFFSLIKFLGSKEEVFHLQAILEKRKEFAVSSVKDPLSTEIYLNLITSPLVDKGNTLKKMRSFFSEGTLFIAAGDDFNDVPMLQEADLSIVMKTAHPSIWEHADILAESAKECGIIAALAQAINQE